MRIVSAILFICLAACAGNPVQDRNVGEEFKLAVGEQAKVAPTSLIVKFERVIEDSRCPMNARCIWEGNAKIELGIEETTSPRNGVEQTVRKTADLDTSERFSQRRSYGAHDIVLVHLDPTPMTGQTVTDYVATLRVEARP